MDLDIQNLSKSIASYQELKKRNEDFIKKKGVSPGAIIKAQSNVMVITMKLEMFDNQRVEIQEKKKVNQCSSCPTVKGSS